MEVKRITKEELKQKIDAKEDCVIIDVRNSVAYASSRYKIKGAIQTTVDGVEALSKNLPKEKEAITYCTWTDEHSSTRAAQILAGKGFKDAKALLGGFDPWLEAGYPVEPK